ncbi:hypothetical protein ACT6M6_007600, partial [Klebsiella pneumoniae]
SVHHIWCPLSSQEYQDLPDGAETTLTIILQLLLHLVYMIKHLLPFVADKPPEVVLLHRIHVIFWQHRQDFFSFSAGRFSHVLYR